MKRVLAVLLFIAPLGAMAAPVVPAPEAHVSVTWHGQLYSRCIPWSRFLDLWAKEPGLLHESQKFFGAPVIATRNQQMAYLCWRQKLIFPTVPLGK